MNLILRIFLNSKIWKYYNTFWLCKSLLAQATNTANNQIKTKDSIRKGGSGRLIWGAADLNQISRGRLKKWRRPELQTTAIHLIRRIGLPSATQDRTRPRESRSLTSILLTEEQLTPGRPKRRRKRWSELRQLEIWTMMPSFWPRLVMLRFSNMKKPLLNLKMAAGPTLSRMKLLRSSLKKLSMRNQNHQRRRRRKSHRAPYPSISTSGRKTQVLSTSQTMRAEPLKKWKMTACIL